MSRATIDPAAVEARVRQRIAERGLPPDQAELVFAKIRPKLETAGLLPPVTEPRLPGSWLGNMLGVKPPKVSDVFGRPTPFVGAVSGPAPTDPLAVKYGASGAAFTESGGVIPTFNRDPTGNIIPPDRQIQPMNHSPEVLRASRSITPAEITAMRETAALEGGNLDGQPDELVAVLAAARKMGRENVMLSGGPTVTPDRPPESPLGRFVDSNPITRTGRDVLEGLVSGAIVQPGAAITSTIGAGFDMARSPEWGGAFGAAAEQMQRQNPGRDSLAFKGGQIGGNVATFAATPFMGPGGAAFALTLAGTQGFGAGVQEYRQAKATRGEPIDPEEQALVGLAYGAIELGTEKIGLDRMFKALPGAGDAVRAFAAAPSNATASAVLNVMAPVMMTNAAEEGAAQLGQNATARGVFDPNRPLTEGVGESAVGGAFGGAIMSAPGAVAAGTNAAFQARLEAAQRAAAQPQLSSSPRSTTPVVPPPPEAPQTDPAISTTMPPETPGAPGDTEAGTTAEDADAARVDQLLAILEDDALVGTPEYEAARAEMDAMFPGFGEDAQILPPAPPPSPPPSSPPPTSTPAPSPVDPPSVDQRGPGMDTPTEQGAGPVGANPPESPDGSREALFARPASELRKIARANGLDSTGPKSAVVERLLSLGRTVLPAGGGGLFAAALPGDAVPVEGSRGDDAVRADAGDPVGDVGDGPGGSGHGRLYAHTQELVSEGSLTPDQADVLNEAFADADPVSLDRIPFRRTMNDAEATRPDGDLNPGLTEIKDGKVISVRMLRRLETLPTKGERMGRERAPEHRGIAIFLEEFGHAAVYATLTEAERAAAKARFESLTPKQRKTHVQQGLTEGAVSYHAGNVVGQTDGFDEFMASGFRDYVLARSGSQPQKFPAFRKWFVKIGQRLRTALDRVMRRKPIPELQTLHEIMRSGRREGDAPAATTPAAPASTPTTGPTTLAGPKITRIADDDGKPKSKLQQRREEIDARKATREAVKQVDGTAKQPPTVTEPQALRQVMRGQQRAAANADRTARREERDEAALQRDVRDEAAGRKLDAATLVGDMLARAKTPPADAAPNERATRLAMAAAARVVDAPDRGVIGVVREVVKAEPDSAKGLEQDVLAETRKILGESRTGEAYDVDKLEEAVARRLPSESPSARDRGQAARAIDGKAKDAPTVTEAEALKARYKGERKAANAADREARKEEREKAKMSRRQQAAKARDEMSMLKDTLKAAARNSEKTSGMVQAMLQRTADQLDRKLTRAEIANGLREQLVETLTNTLPASIRGKLLTDVRDIKSLSDMARALSKARKELAKFEGRDAIRDARRNTRAKVLAGLTEARRATIDALVQDVGAAKQALQTAKTVDDLEAAAQKLREAADKIIEQIAEHRNENAVIRGQERADAGEWVRKVDERLKARHSLRPRDERGKLQQRPWTERAAMKMLDGETFAMKLDDHFTDDVNDDIAPVRKLLYDDLTQAQNRKFAIIEKAVGELDVLAKKAGYANMHDALRVLGDDVLGEASTQYIDVKVGGRNSIPLGVALKIYALDPETRFKAVNGRRFKFVDDLTGKSVLLTPATFAAVTRAIPLELRRFVDAAKDVRDGLRADLFAVHRMMKGYEPVAVERYEPTRVDPWSSQEDIDINSADAVKSWLDGFDVKQWENSGFLQNRQNNASAPLLLTNWANDLVRSIDGAASVIAIAPAVRNANMVLGSGTVTSTLSDIFGTGAVERVQELIAIASGVGMSPSHLFGRVTETMTRNVSRSLTQFSEQSYLKQLGGLFKLAAEMPASAAARGLRGMLSPGAREEMLRNSAYLRARSSLPAQALFAQLGASGVLPTEGSAKAAGRAIVASSREAGRRLLRLQVGRAYDQVHDIFAKSMPALLDTISLAQWFDQLPARMAWAGFNGAGTSPATAAELTEKAMRRSANPSNAMDQSGFAIGMRRSGFGFMVAFTGDPFKSFAQLYRAQQVGGSYQAKVYAGVLGNVLWSAMVTVALKKGAAAVGQAILGGDDEDEETITDAAERVAWLAAKDLAGIVPFGSSVASIVEIAANQTGLKPNVVDTPLAGAINRAADGLLQAYRGIRAAFEERTEAEQKRMVDDLMNGLWQSGVAIGSMLGLPLPVVDRIQRNVRAGMKEEPTSEKIQRFEESQGERSDEEQAKITRARTLAADAVMAGSVVQLRKQLQALEAAGEPLDYRELRKVMERRHPLARLPENKREAFIAGLKPGERSKMLREIKQWQTQFDDRERLFERARP